ncbi:restriction endonuclease [Eubacteriales bacterium mix99]
MSPASLSLKERISEWKIRRKRIRYYRQGKSVSLPIWILNLLLTEFLLFMAGYLWFLHRTRIPILSLALALTINALVTVAFALRKRKSFQKEKADGRRQVAKKRLMENIRQLDRTQFKWQITQMLLKCRGIGSLKDQGDHLEATFHGRKTAIGCYHADLGEEMPPQALNNFLNQAKAEGAAEAVFISSGTYSESCRTISEKKSRIPVHLLDLDSLLQIMEECGMFPEESIIDSWIDEEISHQKRKPDRLRKELRSSKRIRTNLGYSLLFLLLSRWLKSQSAYYTVVSAVFLFLALGPWLWNKKDGSEPTKEQKFMEDLAAGEKS